MSTGVDELYHTSILSLLYPNMYTPCRDVSVLAQPIVFAVNSFTSTDLNGLCLYAARSIVGVTALPDCVSFSLQCFPQVLVDGCRQVDHTLPHLNF